MGKLYISRIRVNNFINITSYGGYGYGDVPKPQEGYGYGYGDNGFTVTNNFSFEISIEVSSDPWGYNTIDSFNIPAYSTVTVSGQYIRVSTALGGVYINGSNGMYWTELVPGAENIISDYPVYGY